MACFKLHIQRNGTRVLENVTPDGQEIQGSDGRQINPGLKKLDHFANVDKLFAWMSNFLCHCDKRRTLLLFDLKASNSRTSYFDQTMF